MEEPCLLGSRLIFFGVYSLKKSVWSMFLVISVFGRVRVLLGGCNPYPYYLTLRIGEGLGSSLLCEQIRESVVLRAVF